MRHILQSLPLATALLGLILIVGGHPAAQEALTSEVQAAFDRAAADVLRQTGAPSASIAVVRAGSIAYLHAYGTATISPAVPAATSMRYSIGSISKQFTAAAVLLLVEEGRLSLDDKVARWFPDLTQADEVSVRQLLSMTSGYQDFWPEDYVMPPMLEPVTPRAILDRWARKPLDFNPGTKWQYSNTNYVIAGLIVEQVSGQPLFEFLRQRIFAPLKMSSVVNSDIAPLGPDDPARYLRYALGPARPAPKEGAGWMFGAGELAMTATDLARWDIATIAHSLLQPSSYQQMQTETVLANGAGTRYGLGVSVGTSNGKRVISHSGEVSGFTARNTIYPDDDVAVVVLTNLDATTASSQLATRIEGLVFKQGDASVSPQAEQARSVFEGLQRGRLDRSLFTPNANAYFSRQALDDFQSSLRGLGTPREFSEVSGAERGGMAFREYRIAFKQKTLRVTTYTMPDGKLEQYIVATDD
jgi:CubicO group peptidase (beta-lactamase class C family)